MEIIIKGFVANTPSRKPIVPAMISRIEIAKKMRVNVLVFIVG